MFNQYLPNIYMSKQITDFNGFLFFCYFIKSSSEFPLFFLMKYI